MNNLTKQEPKVIQQDLTIKIDQKDLIEVIVSEQFKKFEEDVDYINHIDTSKFFNNIFLEALIRKLFSKVSTISDYKIRITLNFPTKYNSNKNLKFGLYDNERRIYKKINSRQPLDLEISLDTAIIYGILHIEIDEDSDKDALFNSIYRKNNDRKISSELYKEALQKSFSKIKLKAIVTPEYFVFKDFVENFDEATKNFPDIVSEAIFLKEAKKTFTKKIIKDSPELEKFMLEKFNIIL